MLIYEPTPGDMSFAVQTGDTPVLSSTGLV